MYPRNSSHENPGLQGRSTSFGGRSGVVRESFWERSGNVLGLFGVRSEVVRQSFMDHSKFFRFFPKFFPAAATAKSAAADRPPLRSAAPSPNSPQAACAGEPPLHAPRGGGGVRGRPCWWCERCFRYCCYKVCARARARSALKHRPVQL